MTSAVYSLSINEQNVGDSPSLNYWKHRRIMKIDMHTLAIILGVIFLIHALIVFFQHLTNKSFKGIVLWALGYVAFAFGLGFLYLREAFLLQSFALVIQNLLIYTGFVFLYFGSARFMEKRASAKLIALLSFVFIILLCHYSLIDKKIVQRSIVNYTSFSFLLFFTSRLFFERNLARVKTSSLFMACFLMLVSCFFLIAAIHLGISASPSQFITQAFLETNILLTGIICSNLLTFGLILMINERLNTEIKLAKEDLETIFNSSPEASIITRLEDGMIIKVSNGFLNMHGYTRDSLLGKPRSILKSWKSDKERRKARDEIYTRGACENFEATFLRKDGTEFIGVISGKILHLHGVPHIITVSRDISGRKQMEAALWESKKILEQAQRIAQIGYYTEDLRTGIWQGSSLLDSILGINSSFVPGNETWKYDIHPEWRQKMQDYFVKVFEEKTEFKTEYQIIRRNDKQVRWISECGKFERDPLGNPIRLIGVIQDITDKITAQEEKGELQAKLFHSAKLASIGILAAGITHEINNPLSIVRGFLHLSERRLLLNNQFSSDFQEWFYKQDVALSRIESIVNGLRTFARLDSETMQVIDVHKVILDTLDIIRSIFEKDGVEFSLDLRSPSPYLLGNIGKFQQVLLNLFTNSKDSFETGGIIKIETSNTEEDLRISISDNGLGIEPKYLRNIFDPFFTTKPPGKGTGLGLSIVHSIVELFKGTISVSSEVRLGTTFSLVFPLPYEEKGSITHPLPEKKVVSTSLKEKWSALAQSKVLIVDDEDSIREIIEYFLDASNFHIVSARDGREALEILTREPFDVVITDLKMPHMRGEKLILETQKLNPATKFIVITGGTLDDCSAEQKGILTKFAPVCLKKPFTEQDIYLALQSCAN